MVAGYSYYEAQKEFVRFHDLKEGDRVKILRASTRGELGWNNDWNPSMHNCVGAIVVIYKMLPGGILARGDGSYWEYPFFVLEKIKEEIPPAELAEELSPLSTEMRYLAKAFITQMEILTQEIMLLRRGIKE